jgi:hypothetical protein
MNINSNLTTSRWSYFFFLLLLSSPSFGTEPETSKGQLRDRLGEVFYWQISDSLNLKTEVEKKMILILEESQKRREALFQKRDADFKKYHREFQTLPPEDFLKAFETHARELHAVDLYEFQELKKIFTPSQMTQFLLFRDSFSKRVREALKRVESRKSGQ